SSSTTFQTRLAKCGCTVGMRLMVRETVAVDTFARRAISRIFMVLALADTRVLSALGHSRRIFCRRLSKRLLASHTNRTGLFKASSLFFCSKPAICARAAQAGVRKFLTSICGSDKYALCE